MLKNLKDETLGVLANYGKTIDDILWIGTKNFRIPSALFWGLANKEYDSGYGCPHVATDLLIVGEDFWLEREEYNGFEWWEYREKPQCPFAAWSNIHRIIDDDGWETVEEMNGKDK